MAIISVSELQYSELLNSYSNKTLIPKGFLDIALGVDVSYWNEPSRPYAMGSVVIHNGNMYESSVDNNSATPGSTGSNWTQVNLYNMAKSASGAINVVDGNCITVNSTTGVVDLTYSSDTLDVTNKTLGVKLVSRGGIKKTAGSGLELDLATKSGLTYDSGIKVFPDYGLAIDGTSGKLGFKFVKSSTVNASGLVADANGIKVNIDTTKGLVLDSSNPKKLNVNIDTTKGLAFGSSTDAYKMYVNVGTGLTHSDGKVVIDTTTIPTLTDGKLSLSVIPPLNIGNVYTGNTGGRLLTTQVVGQGDVFVESVSGGTYKSFMYVGPVNASGQATTTELAKEANWVELTKEAFSLSPATSSALGGVMVSNGDGFTYDTGTGALSLSLASGTTKGIVYQGTGVTISNGKVSVDFSTSISDDATVTNKAATPSAVKTYVDSAVAPTKNRVPNATVANQILLSKNDAQAAWGTLSTDSFSVDTTASPYTLKLKIASASAIGGVKLESSNASFTVNSTSGVITLNKASATVLGGIKIDSSSNNPSFAVNSTSGILTLNAASTTVLGGIKIASSNASFSVSSGVLQLSKASTSVLGGVKIASSNASFAVSASTGVITLNKASNTVLGGVRIQSDSGLSINSSGDLSIDTTTLSNSIANVIKTTSGVVPGSASKDIVVNHGQNSMNLVVQVYKVNDYGTDAETRTPVLVDFSFGTTDATQTPTTLNNNITLHFASNQSDSDYYYVIIMAATGASFNSNS